MSYNAWMPLNGQTVGKSYDYSTKKAGANANKANDRTKGKEKDLDDFWKLSAESYVPSAEAEQYRVKQDSSYRSGVDPDVKLSKKAQNLLAQLKEKYSDMDFFVASYTSEADAQKYLRRGSKEYSVLIDPETLEAMAADESVRKKYEDVLAGAGGKFEELKEKLGEDADKVENFGISIDREGKVSYFAELDRISESREKQLESAKEKRAEAKKAEKKKAQKDAKARQQEKAEEKHEFVKADTIDELVKLIKEGKPEAETEQSEGMDIVM